MTTVFRVNDPAPGPWFSGDILVDVVDVCANDGDVINAARVSTVGEQVFDPWRRDNGEHTGLINFLMKNRHGTPFEHNLFKFFVNAPIFVFREFHRHRIGFSYNEESGRYRELEGKFYIPDHGRDMVQVGRPGHYSFETGTEDDYGLMRTFQEQACRQAYSAYQSQLRAGIAKEVARMVLPVSTFSSMYVTCNARSLMAFLSLRQKRSEDEATFPSTPMYEINVVANKMETVFADAMPLTHAAFVKNGYVAP